MKFEKHIFICINERGVNNPRKSCGKEHGMELVKAFKKQLLDRGLKIKMRAQHAGCLDGCDTGPTVVVYPEGVYYGGVQLSDVDEIVEEHLVKGNPVERLRLS